MTETDKQPANAKFGGNGRPITPDHPDGRPRHDWRWRTLLELRMMSDYRLKP
jgi:hypothetical protein